MLTLYPLLGVDAFQLPRVPALASVPAKEGQSGSEPALRAPLTEPLELVRAGQTVARLRVHDGTFILLAGSRIRRRRNEGRNVAAVRSLLHENGKLKDHNDTYWELVDGSP